MLKANDQYRKGIKTKEGNTSLYSYTLGKVFLNSVNERPLFFSGNHFYLADEVPGPGKFIYYK